MVLLGVIIEHFINLECFRILGMTYPQKKSTVKYY